MAAKKKRYIIYGLLGEVIADSAKEAKNVAEYRWGRRITAIKKKGQIKYPGLPRGSGAGSPIQE